MKHEKNFLEKRSNYLQVYTKLCLTAMIIQIGSRTLSPFPSRLHTVKSSSFEPVLQSLLCRTRSQGRFCSAIRFSHRPEPSGVQSMTRWVDWTLENNMVDGLFFCNTLTYRRGAHTSSVQAGAGTSDTGAETVKPDPRCSWEGHSGRVGTEVDNESTESREVVQPLCFPLVIRAPHVCCCCHMK